MKNNKNNKYKPQEEYKKRVGTKKYTITCLLHTETDIINFMEKQANKSGTVKTLIRQEIEKQSNKE